MLKIIKTVENVITEKTKEYGYLFTSEAPETTPLNSPIVGAALSNDICLELKRRVLQSDVDPEVSFTGCFKPDSEKLEIEYHYLAVNKNNHNPNTCILVKANSSDINKNVFSWTTHSIQSQSDSIFIIKDYDIKYEELLSLYFFNRESLSIADTFYEFIENKQSYILSKLLS